jgi:hypothetical protein
VEEKEKNKPLPNTLRKYNIEQGGDQTDAVCGVKT